MAGTEEPESQELQQESESSFLWDETCQLYFHARSGFYHDPTAGWYYSSKDGQYYKFEDGNYVLLESDKGNESEPDQCVGTLSYESVLDEPSGHTELYSNHGSENVRPTSEWLEDTLIDLYLSGYSKSSVNAADDVRMPLEADDGDDVNVSADGAGDPYELEEGEWIPEDHGTDQCESFFNEGAALDEEKWKAQYGQVIQSGEESLPHISAVDLWDWVITTGSKKDGNGQVSRLVGRLVKRSSKLHPSMPSGGGCFKTAPIREVHLDLVRVTSGRVYKLRTPSARHLASLSLYDSSNPTKDWGFPELSIEEQILPFSGSSGNCESKTEDGANIQEDSAVLPDIPSNSGKQGTSTYRDRAAERRKLHGGFGVGPGQKNIVLGDVDSPSSPVSGSTEIAAAEALNMSFGAGSYARKLLESMGWKEGDALGKTTKGLKEPLKAVGNKGNAGLGWTQGRTETILLVEAAKILHASESRRATIELPDINVTEDLKECIPEDQNPEIEEADAARRRFPNAKLISSAQFFGDQEKMNDIEEAKLSLWKFSTSTAISIADLFGRGVNNSPPICSTQDWIKSKFR